MLDIGDVCGVFVVQHRSFVGSKTTVRFSRAAGMHAVPVLYAYSVPVDVPLLFDNAALER